MCCNPCNSISPKNFKALHSRASSEVPGTAKKVKNEIPQHKAQQERKAAGGKTLLPILFDNVLFASVTTKGWGIFYKCNLGASVILCPHFPSSEIQNINIWEDVGIHEQQAADSAGEEQWWRNPACAHNRLCAANGVDQHRICDSEKLQSHPDWGAHWFERLRRGNSYW